VCDDSVIPNHAWFWVILKPNALIFPKLLAKKITPQLMRVISAVQM
jgi:hypothetical protein